MIRASTGSIKDLGSRSINSIGVSFSLGLGLLALSTGAPFWSSLALSSIPGTGISCPRSNPGISSSSNVETRSARLPFFFSSSSGGGAAEDLLSVGGAKIGGAWFAWGLQLYFCIFGASRLIAMLRFLRLTEPLERLGWLLKSACITTVLPEFVVPSVCEGLNGGIYCDPWFVSTSD